jgi:hypothetical protein
MGWMRPGEVFSYGRRTMGSNTLADFGYSESTDGLIWTNVKDVLDANGWGYGSTNATIRGMPPGGLCKTVNNQCPSSNGALACPLSPHPATLAALAVYPKLQCRRLVYLGSDHG